MAHSPSFGLQKRLALIALLAFLPAFGLALYANHEQRELALAAAENQATAAVRQVAAAQARVVGRAWVQAETLVDVPIVRNGPPPACSDYLAHVRDRQSGAIANISRVDASGRVTCSAVPIAGPVDVSGSEVTRRGLAAGKPTVSDYEFGEIVRHGIVAVTAPILDELGQARGLVVTSIDLRWLRQIFAGMNMLPGTRLTLLDHQGIVLARFPDDVAAPGLPAPQGEALLRAAQQRPAGGSLRIPSEPDHLYAFAHLATAGDGLLVYAAVPTAVIEAGAQAQFLRQMLGLALALLATVAATAFVGRRLVVRPVRRLQETARRLAAGELDARTEFSPGNDEIYSLSRSFDDMAASLQARDATLRERQAQIERLNRVYAVLSGINSLIIRVIPREQLLREACRIAVERSGFALAWIGLLDEHGRRFVSITADGGEPAARAALVPAKGASPADWPELQSALAEGRPAVLSLTGNDMPPRLRAAEGYAACVVLPLKPEQRVTGCMVLFAQAAETIDALEMQLLEEMAADISHALAFLGQGERLAYVSSTDAVTGLPNLARFQDRLRLALQLMGKEAPPAELAVMLVRVEGVRVINAAHGLHVGDQVLREAAQRLRAALPPDTLLARLRGGVFGIALAKSTQTDLITTTVQKIICGFDAAIEAAGVTLSPSVRIGISLWPADGSRAEALIQHAETALSHASAMPEQFRFFIPELQRLAEQRLALENELHQALERDELYLVYQPVVAVAGRRLTGVEALVRWRHPTRGEISPGGFIPVAEASGLIVPLGTWAMREAFRQARRWSEAGIEIKVAVNVAARQMMQPDFLQTVDEVVREAGIDPQRFALGIELTESELMEDAPRAADLLAKLKARGFALSIDDFGTGYSSLAYLEQFPLDVLKIDVAFIRDLADNPSSVSIVEAILALARALKLSTIAEGVETAAQFARLERMGCEAVQGHLFGRAMPAERIAALAGRELPLPATTRD